jgi:hypothetical protein
MVPGFMSKAEVMSVLDDLCLIQVRSPHRSLLRTGLPNIVPCATALRSSMPGTNHLEVLTTCSPFMLHIVDVFQAH